MTRLLGIDVGERRLGLAIADGEEVPARALTTIRRRRDPVQDASTLGELIAGHRIDALVVGLPLDTSGGEGSQAAATRAWVEAIEPHLDVPISFRDERLSSHLAEARLGPMKRGRSGGPPSRTQRDEYRARVDREAAAIILQDELDARAAAVATTAAGDVVGTRERR